MIGIEIDGEFLELQGAKIRLSFRSQIFSREFVAAHFSFPFTVPYTANNARILGHLERIANTRTAYEISCRLHLGGSSWRDGVLVFRGFTTGYDCDLRIPEDDVILRLRELSTRDLTTRYDFIMEPIGSTATWTEEQIRTMMEQYEGDADETDIIFAPVLNTGMFGDREEVFFNAPPDSWLFTGIPQLYMTQPYVNHYDADRYNPLLITTDANEFWFQKLSPYPYLVKVMEHLLGLVDMELGGDVFEDPEVRTAVVLGNYLQYGGVWRIGGEFQPYIFSDYSGWSQEPSVNNLGNPLEPYIYLRDLLPDMTGLEFLLRIMKRFNAIPVFSGQRTVRLRSMNAILSDPAFEDITHMVVPDRRLEMDQISGYELQEDPEGLDKLSGADDQLNPDRLRGTFDTEEDISVPGAQIGDQVIVLVPSSIYELTVVDGGSTEWVFQGFYFGTVSAGTDPETIDTGVGFTGMFRGVDVLKDTRSWLVPHVQMTLKDRKDLHRTYPAEMETLRLMFFRGMQTDDQGDDYPLLSNDIYDVNGDPIPGATMREMLAGDGGIYEVWYKQWLKILMNGKVITRKVRMPLDRVKTFPWDKKWMIDGSLYLCRSIDLEVTTTGYGLAIMEFMILENSDPPVPRPV
jgi:hypothetical protein